MSVLTDKPAIQSLDAGEWVHRKVVTLLPGARWLVKPARRRQGFFLARDFSRFTDDTGRCPQPRHMRPCTGLCPLYTSRRDRAQQHAARAAKRGQQAEKNAYRACVSAPPIRESSIPASGAVHPHGQLLRRACAMDSENVTACYCEHCQPWKTQRETWTEAWRHACEVRQLAGLSTNEERKVRLAGIAERRGKAAADRIRMDVWAAMKGAA